MLSGVYFHIGRYEQSLTQLLKNLKIHRFFTEERRKAAEVWITRLSQIQGLSYAVYELGLKVAELCKEGDEIKEVKRALE
jgi:hypothetical protein